MYVCMHACIYIYIHMYHCVYIYIHMYNCIYIYMCVCVCKRVDACMCARLYIYIIISSLEGGQTLLPTSMGGGLWPYSPPLDPPLPVGTLDLFWVTRLDI